MFQRGVSPVRLSKLDVRPAVEAAQMVAAAKANLNSSVNQSILDFAQKQQKKKQDKIGIKAIQNMYGLDDATAKAVYSDEIVRDAFVQKQKADADLARRRKEELQLKILQDEQQRVQEQRDIFEKAIAVNTTPEGTVDMSNVRQSFVELGGRDEKVFGDLFNVRGEIEITKEGVIKQDTPEGEKFYGQISSKFLNKEGGDGDPKPSVDGIPTFNTIEEAEAANLPLGTRVIIGGRDAIIG